MTKSPPFEPGPDVTGPPGVSQCFVLIEDRGGAERVCRRTWDRKHTILGFGICDECYAAVRDETVHTSPAPVGSSPQ